MSTRYHMLGVVKGKYFLGSINRSARAEMTVGKCSMVSVKINGCSMENEGANEKERITISQSIFYLFKKDGSGLLDNNMLNSLYHKN